MKGVYLNEPEDDELETLAGDDILVYDECNADVPSPEDSETDDDNWAQENIWDPWTEEQLKAEVGAGQ